MFNLLPGQGMGHTGSQEIAFGFLPVSLETVYIPRRGGTSKGNKGTYNKFIPIQRVANSPTDKPVTLVDNIYSRQKDDAEICEILLILIEVIE